MPVKPLPAAPLTTEDYYIWDMRTPNLYHGSAWESATECDRRDAELMRRIARRLAVMKWRRHEWPARTVALICVEPVFWPPEGAWEVDITFCA